MDKENKSEFACQMEAIAEQATALVAGQENKSVIIITTESDDDGTLAMVAIAGKGTELAKGVAELATSKESRPFFSFGLHLAQKKIAANAFEAMLDEMLK